MGAWIEIKIAGYGTPQYPQESLLSWERGLKLRMDEFRHTTEEVAPLVGAWIEIWLLLSFIGVGIVSLLSWERGLK